MGNKGSYIVELAASWTIVMILSGLFLWWPRGGGLAGVVWPRLRSRWRWRDLHAVTGFWVSMFALLFLFSGLPWAKSWGDYLQFTRTSVAREAPPQDWAFAGTDALKQRAAADQDIRAALGVHAGHHHSATAGAITDYATLNRLVPQVRAMELAAPVLISPPTGSGNLWPARSDAANRPLRASVFVDGTSGKVVARDTFAERPLVDRLVGYGVAAHEGQLFGALNQVINLFVALGLMLLAISSAVLWWRRRPAGQLGAPRSLPAAPAAFAFVALVVLLGLLLPLFGLSLLAFLIVERMALRRMRGPSRCLGLSSA